MATATQEAHYRGRAAPTTSITRIQAKQGRGSGRERVPMPQCPSCRRNIPGATCPFCRFGAPTGLRGVARAPVAGPAQVVPGALPVGAQIAIKCARVGQVAFVELDPAKPLYVLRGTRLEFRATTAGPGGHGVSFATATWSGSAGAVGQGASKQVHFAANATSNSLASGKTVTLTLGGQTVTIAAIVFELRATAQIQDNFAGRSTADLGVDERVTLGFTTTPAGVTADQAGGLRWRFADGSVANRDTVGLFHDPGTNTAPPAHVNTGVAKYIAPCRTSPARVAPVPQHPVKLKLSIESGVCAGEGPEIGYTIHSPNAHMRERVGGARRHVHGRPSCGFKGEIFLTPRNVSFRTLRWREGVGQMKVSGNVPAAWMGLAHPTTAFGDASHGTVNDGDINNGCTVNQLDDVWSGSFAYTVPDRASPRNVVGTQEWPIEWEYTYPILPAGGWSNDWIAMQKAYHRATLYEDGAIAMFKGHVRCATGDCMAMPVRKEIDDPSVA